MGKKLVAEISVRTGAGRSLFLGALAVKKYFCRSFFCLHFFMRFGEWFKSDAGGFVGKKLGAEISVRTGTGRALFLGAFAVKKYFCRSFFCLHFSIRFGEWFKSDAGGFMGKKLVAEISVRTGAGRSLFLGAFAVKKHFCLHFSMCFGTSCPPLKGRYISHLVLSLQDKRVFLSPPSLGDAQG
ncbi:hypothetical protein [Pontiella sp.]|uniref:hypothetical protein n=1 Tax=Pontiella sp. TaxID=2837462 RepID=UPI003561B0F6